MASANPNNQAGEPADDYDPQTQVIGNWKIVDLPEITIVPPEANYDLIAVFDAKLYRFNEPEWCERGQGQLKFLQHKEDKKIVLVMRQRKTFFIRANHFVHKTESLCKLIKSVSYQNCWQWFANDISDSAPKTQHFSVQLQSQQDSERFQSQFSKACNNNEDLF